MAMPSKRQRLDWLIFISCFLARTGPPLGLFLSGAAASCLSVRNGRISVRPGSRPMTALMSSFILLAGGRSRKRQSWRAAPAASQVRKGQCRIKASYPLIQRLPDRLFEIQPERGLRRVHFTDPDQVCIAFQHLHHPVKANIGRVIGQQITTLHALDTADKTGPAQKDKGLLQVFDGNRLSDGDLFQGLRDARILFSQIDQGSQAITASGCQSDADPSCLAVLCAFPG